LRFSRVARDEYDPTLLFDRLWLIPVIGFNKRGGDMIS